MTSSVENNQDELEKLFETSNDQVAEKNDADKSTEALSEGQNINEKIEDHIKLQPETRTSPLLTKDFEASTEEKNQGNETKEIPELENVPAKIDSTVTESKDININVESLSKFPKPEESERGETYNIQNESMEIEYPSNSQHISKSPGTTSETPIAENHSNEIGRNVEMEETKTEEVNENGKDNDSNILDHGIPEIDSGNKNQIMQGTVENKTELGPLNNEEDVCVFSLIISIMPQIIP